MAESSGFQGLEKLLKAQLNRGFELVRELKFQLNFAQGPDRTNLICNYSDKIVTTFSAARALISLNSSASNFEGTENPIENYIGGIEAGHSQKYVKDNRNSYARSPSRSPCPPSRSPSPTGYNSPSNLSELSVSRNGLGTGKQKCHEFAQSSENEGLSKDREPAISRKRKYTPTSTKFVPANSSEPGNDIPPEDGYTWRKYGQKEILGDKHPRLYYKCTYRDDRGCEAKKIVQRPNDNPSVFEVKYSELHSCQHDAQFLKSPLPGSPIKTPFPISAFQDTNANPNSITPTACVFGTDSNLISSNSSIGNVATQPPTDFLSSSITPLFAAYDSGVTLDNFVRSPSNLSNVDSSAEREMPFDSDEIPVSIFFEEELETPWFVLEKELETPLFDSTSEADYMPSTNSPMQTRDP